MKLIVDVSNAALRRAVGTLAILGAIAGAYFIGTARADGVPTTDPLFYAGTLEENGVPATGARSVQVQLWTAQSGGTAQCTTGPVSVDFVAGHFRLPLASSCKAAIHQFADLFAEVTIGGTVLPRSKLGAVPYAIEAERALTSATADDADLLDGADATAFAAAAHIHDTGAITSGTLPINRGGTGINTVAGNGNRLLGANSAGTAWETKNVTGTSGEIAVTHTAGAVNIGFANLVPYSCSYESASAAGVSASVTCPAGKKVVGGGAACAPSNDQGAADENRLKYTRPDSTRTAWNVTCTAASKTAYAYAICCTE